MANQPSPYPVLCASFNQDNSYFAVGTKLGFKIFQADTGGLCYEKDIGAFSIVEMRFSSSLLAIVGAGEQPALSPRRLCLFNTTTGAPLQELNFLTSVLAVRLSKQRLIVLLEDKTFIYDIDRLSILSTIDTIPNPKGLCAFSHKPEACFLALPASTAKGSVLVYNVMDLQSHCEIEAHRSPLAAMVLSSDGAYLATASEQGTIVRVHTISEGTEHVNSGVDIIDITLEATRKLRGQLDYDMHNDWGSFPCFTSCVSDSHKLKYFSFRRGTYPSTIFSLSFGLSLELPDVLAATSSSGSLHVFMLASAINQRSRASGSFIGSIIPGSISDVLDPAHHHVLHKAVPEGVRSYAVIRKVEKVVDNSASQVLSFRAVISIISYNGYFQEYMLSINCKNEAAWSLDREYNLLTAIPDTNPAS